MATTRAALAAYIANEVRPLFARAGQEAVDSPEGTRYVLDKAYMRLGLTAGDEVSDELLEAARALVKYYAILRVWERVAIPNKGQDPDTFKNVAALIRHMEQVELQDLGIVVDSRDRVEMGDLWLDWMEPPRRHRIRLWGDEFSC